MQEKCHLCGTWRGAFKWAIRIAIKMTIQMAPSLHPSLENRLESLISDCKALRHVENLFIQRFLFIYPRFLFIVQGSLLVVQYYKPWMNNFLGVSKYYWTPRILI